ncbi:universal stress protein [Pseudodesulfovibrio sp. JC047]|uniref:universal stress protein n=1 Tax=Pseudodesulfovibrio sp. JC047 TaxID=2683199 RepID=UPI0013D129C9|nr:universal stress protein [Pseudodesulfovibrio sp. JC047]NDV19919.1 universal stress protein [Pseudodesulfovibrio sp. JC047]
MQKELLLAIGDDRAASFNLRFLKELFDNFCDIKLTLFYVAPKSASWAMHEENLVPAGDDLVEFMAHKKDKGKKALVESRQWLKDMTGCPDDNVRIKVIHSRKGTVRELIEECRSGLYDAMLLGRKAFSWFEAVFENSVCHELIWQDIDFPIWVCKRPTGEPRHDVLLCLDGSDASLRMADHASYMLADETKHAFTLFHTVPKEAEIAVSDPIFNAAVEVMERNGVTRERIVFKPVVERNVVKAIVQETAQHPYAAVGVGRHGTTRQGTKENLFPTSVSINLLRQLPDTALWVSK